MSEGNLGKPNALFIKQIFKALNIQ